ncbi:MAG: hypothetical protein Q8N51_15460, partial [Gammaproteobacteria bacterium]|nr:hypothetical protein [Gammaproteobacteria bacterium]
IILDAGNQGVLLFDDNNDSYYGEITFSGGTIRVATQNQALGNVRGTMIVSNSVDFIFNTAITSNKPITYNQGTTFNVTSLLGGTFNFKQTFNNSTTAGLNFNIGAATVASTVGLNLSGVIYGSNGFTKTGNGIMQISANNFSDVYDGYTSINKTATLSGQIAVNGGVLYVGGARALGAHGVGNEVIVASGASLDLRDADLNYGDDSDTARKIIQIQGTGFNGTGALRNTAGTAQLSFLTLDGHATVNSGGQANASVLVLGVFDTNLSNANSLNGAFTANRPVINGGGFDLTVQGARVAADNFIISDPTFSSALGSLIIREGGTVIRHEITAPLAEVGITSANITNGIVIGYGGVTTADLTGGIAGTGANVGARLRFDNWFGTSPHTVSITMDGVMAATATGTPGGPRSQAGGHNFLQATYFTIPNGRTLLNGDIALTGTANRNILISESTGNYSVQEQGNTTISAVGKMVVGGQITGTGGFTKMGYAEVRLTGNNTFTGDLNVLRYGYSSAPFQSNTVRINGVDYEMKGLAEGWAEWGLTLNGASGAIASAASINLQRRGMITLDNTSRLDATSGVAGANNNDRINNAAILNMNNGWLRLNGGTDDNTEAFGTVNILGGTNIFDLYGTDGSGKDIDISIATLNRTAGGTLRFANLDATSTFSSALTAGEDVRVAVTTLNATQIGGGGAVNTTTRSIVQGVFGGNIPLGLDTDFRLLGFNNANITDL